MIRSARRGCICWIGSSVLPKLLEQVRNGVAHGKVSADGDDKGKGKGNVNGPRDRRRGRTPSASSHLRRRTTWERMS